MPTNPSDYTENLITWLRAISGLESVHVGEKIPDEKKFDAGFIHVEQADEIDAGLLCNDFGGLGYLISVFDTDLGRCRTRADLWKNAARAFAPYTSPLTDVQVIEILTSGDDSDRLETGKLVYNSATVIVLQIAGT